MERSDARMAPEHFDSVFEMEHFATMVWLATAEESEAKSVQHSAALYRSVEVAYEAAAVIA